MGEILREGNTYRTACGLIGVSEASFYSWINQGEAIQAEGKPPSKLSVKRKRLLEFFETVKEAVAYSKRINAELIQRVALGGETMERVEHYDSEGNVTKVLEKKAPPNWQASAWLLERRHPMEYGRKERIDVKQESTHDVNVDHKVKVELSEKRAERIASIIHELLPLPPGSGVNRGSEVK